VFDGGEADVKAVGEGPPGSSQGDAVGLPIEERSIESNLQLFDLTGHRWLGNAQLATRCR
jgi:hypothetical protein